jgi:hypothetical protein
MASRTSQPDAITPGRVVGWVVIGALLFWPRLFILTFAVFYDAIFNAFDSWVTPFLGFFLLPWTTITYAAMWGAGANRVFGIEWLFVAFAFAIDLYTWAALRR